MNFLFHHSTEVTEAGETPRFGDTCTESVGGFSSVL